MIGPQPPKPGEEISPEEAIKRNIEARAQKMEDKLLGRNQNAEPKRETWMTELPQTVSKNFGLGPRQFSRSTNAKTKQDKTWTQTPNEIAAGEGSEDAPNPEQDEEVGRILLIFIVFCDALTLTYLINVHAHLTILDFFAPCTHLLYACTLNYFSIFFHPPL